MVFLCFLEHCHGNILNLNVIVVLEFISRDLYLLFAILLSSKFQNSIFYQLMRPKSGLKSPRPFILRPNVEYYFCNEQSASKKYTNVIHGSKKQDKIKNSGKFLITTFCTITIIFHSILFLFSFSFIITFEPPHGKTNNLHRRKQRRRSASR